MLDRCLYEVIPVGFRVSAKKKKKAIRRVSLFFRKRNLAGIGGGTVSSKNRETKNAERTNDERTTNSRSVRLYIHAQQATNST